MAKKGAGKKLREPQPDASFDTSKWDDEYITVRNRAGKATKGSERGASSRAQRAAVAAPADSDVEEAGGAGSDTDEAESAGSASRTSVIPD